MVAKEVTKEEIWIRHVLIELGLIQKYPIELICDNQSVNHIVYNLVYQSKTKCIDLDTHYIKDLVAYGIICLEFRSIEKE